MVQTITPVVHGGRRSRWSATVALHALGATSAAAAFGAMLAVGGSVLGAPWGRTAGLVVGSLAFLYAAREVFALRVPIPDRRRQVPEWWRTAFSPGTAAFLYGVGLGVGFFTYVRFGTLVVASAAAISSGEAVTGAAFMASFGLARGLSVSVMWSGVSTDRVQRVVDRLESLEERSVPTIANVVILLLVGMGALVLPSGDDPGATIAVAPWTLALLFGWASVAKLVRLRPWGATLRGYGLPGPVESLAFPVVPVAETAVPVLALSGHVRVAGGLALSLLLLFSAAVLRARRVRGRKLPCGCFGKTKSRDYRILLLRNAALGFAAVAALAGDPGRSPLDAVRWPVMAEAVPAVFVLLGAGLGVSAVARIVRLRAARVGTESPR